MSEEAHQEIIIVRRRVEGEEGHHGGAWKIAYADFVTAMMAFFLVLWILNSTNKDSQTVIARYFNPVRMEDFARNKKGIRDSQAKEEKAGANEGEQDKSPPAGQDAGRKEQAGKENKDINAKSLMNEETLFQNPYAALDQIAGKAPSQQKKTSGAAAEAGGADAFRDPFLTAASGNFGDEVEETGVQSVDAPKPAQAKSGEAKTGEARTGPARGEQGETGVEKPPRPATDRPGTEQAVAEKAAVEKAATEKAEAAALQKDIARAVKAEAGEGAPQFEVKATDEGLLISLTDSEKFGMFEIGSSSPNPGLVHLMERIADRLKDMKGAVVLRGYTDSRRFKSGTSDNWRLSASRAQMALYMLARGGLPETRVERVEGYADRRPKTPDRPEAAENRRIEILVRKAAP